MAKILLAEDDLALATTIKDWLEFEKNSVEAVKDGAAALDNLLSLEYDVAILDWNLPFMTGVEVCQQYRAKGGAIPIILLTGKNTVKEKEEGLDAGADDYLTKPFHPKELAARLRAMIRRSTGFVPDIVTAGPLTLDRDKHVVLKDGKPVHLQPMEYTLLEFFMKNPNQVFSPETLLAKLWDASSDVSLDAIYTCIRRLRKKLDTPEVKDSIIRTVHGVGYGINPFM
ncbi:MAG: response regulator transcription factor [Candidatus Melainabacteria bacterium]|nr:response regulator transcription factor [Candidatus Melainabacteria bacterium]